MDDHSVNIFHDSSGIEDSRTKMKKLANETHRNLSIDFTSTVTIIGTAGDVILDNESKKKSEIDN